MISLMISDPLRGTVNKNDSRKQWLVPSSVWLTRVLDPLKQTPELNSGMPRFSRLDAEDQKDAKSNIHDFITKYTLTEQSSQATFEAISKNPMSPVTRAMVMMGCYGNPQTNPDMTSADVQSLTAAGSPFLLNILLNTWEVQHILSSSNARQQVMAPPIAVRNDRSACSCLKDFANPLLVDYNADEKSTSTIRAWRRMLWITPSPTKTGQTL